MAGLEHLSEKSVVQKSLAVPGLCGTKKKDLFPHVQLPYHPTYVAYVSHGGPFSSGWSKQRSRLLAVGSRTNA